MKGDLSAEPAQQLEKVSKVHAAIAVVIEVSEEAWIAGGLAKGAAKAEQVLQVYVPVAVSIAEQPEESVDVVSAGRARPCAVERQAR